MTSFKQAEKTISQSNMHGWTGLRMNVNWIALRQRYCREDAWRLKKSCQWIVYSSWTISQLQDRRSEKLPQEVLESPKVYQPRQYSSAKRQHTMNGSIKVSLSWNGSTVLKGVKHGVANSKENWSSNFNQPWVSAHKLQDEQDQKKATMEVFNAAVKSVEFTEIDSGNLVRSEITKKARLTENAVKYLDPADKGLTFAEKPCVWAPTHDRSSHEWSDCRDEIKSSYWQSSKRLRKSDASSTRYHWCTKSRW